MRPSPLGLSFSHKGLKFKAGSSVSDLATGSCWITKICAILFLDAEMGPAWNNCRGQAFRLIACFDLLSFFFSSLTKHFFNPSSLVCVFHRSTDSSVILHWNIQELTSSPCSTRLSQSQSSERQFPAAFSHW